MNKLTKKLKACSEFIDTDYRIGMRVVKTAAAVMICLFIAFLLDSQNLMQISAVSALVTLRATSEDTLHIGLSRLIGTILGGAFGLLTVVIGMFLPYFANGLFVIIIPLMLVIVMYVCNLLKLRDSCSIACVVTIIIVSMDRLDVSVTNAFVYALYRVRDTLIGVSIASLINTLPVPRRKKPEEDSGDGS